MKRRASAIDTNVLSHAVGVRRLGVTEEWHLRALACDQLLQELEHVAIPAPVLTEALRCGGSAEKDQIATRIAKMRVLAVSTPAAVLAARLLAKLRV